MNWLRIWKRKEKETPPVAPSPHEHKFSEHYTGWGGNDEMEWMILFCEKCGEQKFLPTDPLFRPWKD